MNKHYNQSSMGATNFVQFRRAFPSDFRSFVEEDGFGRKDNRVRINSKKAQLYPYSSMGKIQYEFAKETNDVYCGSGTMVAHNFVLTAAHNIFHPELSQSGMPIKFAFKRGLSEEDRFIAQYEGINYIIPQKYRQMKQNTIPSVQIWKYDYALVEVKLKTNKKYSHLEEFQIMELEANLKEESISKKQIQIYGYAANTDYLSGEKGFILNLDEKLLSHKIYTQSGCSGSAIISKDNNKYKIIGIHIGHHKQEVNIGTTISGMIKNINDEEEDQFLTKLNDIMKMKQERRKFQSKEWKNKFTEKWTTIEDKLKFKKSKGKKKTRLELNHKNLSHRAIQALIQMPLSHIKVLSIQGNNLSNEGIVQLTKQSWDSLQTLNIGENMIKSLDQWKAYNIRNVTYLDLSVNLLTEIPINILELNLLQTFKLQFNLLPQIPAVLSQLSSLKYLNLCSNFIRLTTAVNRELIEHFRNNNISLENIDQQR